MPKQGYASSSPSLQHLTRVLTRAANSWSILSGREARSFSVHCSTLARRSCGGSRRRLCTHCVMTRGVMTHCVKNEPKITPATGVSSWRVRPGEFVLASPRRQPCGSNHDRRPCHALPRPATLANTDTRTADAEGSPGATQLELPV